MNSSRKTKNKEKNIREKQGKHGEPSGGYNPIPGEWDDAPGSGTHSR